MWSGLKIDKSLCIWQRKEQPISILDVPFQHLKFLTHGLAADPRCDEPVGQLLIHSAQRLRQPTVEFCTDLATKAEVASKNPIQSEAMGMSFDREDITRSMEQPFLQVQRYPHLLNAIMRAAQTEMSAGVALDLQVSSHLPWHDLPAHS